MKIHPTYRLIAIALAIITYSVSAQAQQFWGKTKYGMPSSAVRALFGNKLKSNPQEKPVSSLSMGTSLCDGDFTVQFDFYNDKLVMVILVSGSGSQRATTVGECVLGDYIGAFGKPESAKRTSIGTDYIFRRGDTVVGLTIWPATDFVSIKYSLKRSDL